MRVWRALVGREPRGSSRAALPTMTLLVVALVSLHSCVAQAQDRLVGRDGRTQGYVDRLPGSRDQGRITGRDGLTRGYVDGSSGRIIGRDGRTQGYIVPERRR